MLYGDKRIPCQLIENHPSGVQPGGTMFRPIYKNVSVISVSTALNNNHFEAGHRGGGVLSYSYLVTIWNRVDDDDNENIQFGEGRIGFEICNRDGMAELLGKTNIRLVTKDHVTEGKRMFKRYELMPRDEAGEPCPWPSSSNLSLWTFPIKIYHREGKFHGNEGGQYAASIIRKTAPANEVAARKKASTIMNTFYMLNPQWEPPNRLGIDGVEFTRLRNNHGDDGENEEMWQRIESGTI